MSDLPVAYAAVPRAGAAAGRSRAQLDGWLRDGSAAYVEAICEWE